jgi:hypothetical protein
MSVPFPIRWIYRQFIIQDRFPLPTIIGG